MVVSLLDNKYKHNPIIITNMLSRMVVRSFCSDPKKVPCNTELLHSINKLHMQIKTMEQRVNFDNNLIFIHCSIWTMVCFPTIIFCSC